MPKNVSSFNSTSPANMTEGEWKSRVECVAGHHLLELYRLTDMVEGMLGLRVEYHKNGQLWMKGTYKDGKPHGQGTYTFTSGSKYVGEYKDGIPHGQGSLTFDDGSEILGEWKSGKPWNVVVYDSSGKFNHNYKDGVPQ